MASSGEVLDGRYELIKQVGAGAMGEVWKAKQLRLEKIVAVKILKPALTGDRHAVERFDREAKTIGSLETHPNIVSVLDSGEVIDTFGVQLYIAMEYVDGSDLSQLIAAGQTGDDQWKIAVLAGIADALHAAHERRIIHRDVKPANILITAGDHIAKLTDFGIALSSRYEANRLTEKYQVIGTPAFVSPEQALGEAILPASDVYSLAVVGYNLFSGHLPFLGSTSSETARLRVQVEPQPLPDIVPADVRALLTGVLSVNNPQRLASAGEFARRLRACRLVLSDDPPTVTIDQSAGSAEGATTTMPHVVPSIRNVFGDIWADYAPRDRVLSLGERLHAGDASVIVTLAAASILLGTITGLFGFMVVMALLTV